MAASGSSGNFQSIPALTPDQVPIPTTRGSVNMYMNLDDNLNVWTVDHFKVHRPISASGGVTIESGTFQRTPAEGSGIQTIVTLKKVKILFFIVTNPSQFATGGSSTGKDNGIDASCVTTSDIVTGFPGADLSNSIHIAATYTGIGKGFTGKVNVINSNSFDVLWTLIGNPITFPRQTIALVQWHAITE
jgi:hypothetical protein